MAFFRKAVTTLLISLLLCPFSYAGKPNEELVLKKKIIKKCISTKISEECEKMDLFLLEMSSVWKTIEKSGRNEKNFETVQQFFIDSINNRTLFENISMETNFIETCAAQFKRANSTESCIFFSSFALIYPLMIFLALIIGSGIPNSQELATLFLKIGTIGFSVTSASMILGCCYSCDQTSKREEGIDNLLKEQAPNSSQLFLQTQVEAILLEIKNWSKFNALDNPFVPVALDPGTDTTDLFDFSDEFRMPIRACLQKKAELLDKIQGLNLNESIIKLNID